MRIQKSLILFLALSFLSSTGFTVPATVPAPKKLIEYGWDVPSPSEIRQNIREMEKLPFDGLIFRLPDEAGIVFKPQKTDDMAMAQVLDDCKGIEWQKFTDNFVCVYAASTMDWFSDQDWEAVRHNLTLVCQAALLSKCKGICFDPEPYGNNPWDDHTQARGKSFAEYQVQVRQRGAEFMSVLLKEFPGCVVHTFFQLSIFGDVMDEVDAGRKEKGLSQHSYALLPAFLNGMLDVAGPDILITDGNESAYYYTDPLEYYEVYHQIRQRALSLVAPENLHKYHTQVQVSQALYVDFVYALGVWGERMVPGRALSPEDQARWFEQDTYYALTTSDEYVWLYSENMDWWKKDRLPAGLEEAVVSARSKVAKQEPLGFEMTDLLKTAQGKLKADLEGRLLRRKASVRGLSKGEKPPVIDGKLDDPIWQSHPALDTFLPYVLSSRPNPEAPTRAWVTCDDKALYVAFQCSEPKMSEMKIVGAERDEEVWDGDSAEVLLSKGPSPKPYVHFILNPKNVLWDALMPETGDDDHDFSPALQSATLQGESEWTAEMALPWSELGLQRPGPGLSLRANLCRNRIPGQEATAWSQTLQTFLESENFGTFIFE